MLHAFYVRATGWLSVPQLERRLALLAFLVTLPSLALGLEADDYILREQILIDGPLAAYQFQLRDRDAAHAQRLEAREDGRAPWFAEAYPHMAFFRPLSSLSLWLDFAHGMPAWWMHLENCALYALIVWLAVALTGSWAYRVQGSGGPRRSSLWMARLP